MDHNIYLEFEEEDMQLSDSLFVDDESFAEDKPETENSIFFMPVFLYRKPMVGAMTIGVDFDPSECQRLHLVVVRYAFQDIDSEVYGQWNIAKVCKTRREAKEIAFAIESGDLMFDNPPWAREGCKLEAVDVVSLAIED